MTDDRANPLPSISVSLRDGTIAELRPIRPEDRQLLLAGFHLMSMESRFARFGTGLSRLTDAELRYLTEVDHYDHVAWGATVEGKPAGAGRFIRTDPPDRAEVAVAVVDRLQGRGLGRSLFNALVASARAVGVDTFSFSIHPTNLEVLEMIQGVDVSMDDEAGLVEGTIDLADVGPIDGEQRYVELLEVYRGAT